MRTTGRLLVATPALHDGVFDRTLVFMLHHDKSGALGVVINQPAEIDAGELLPRWDGHLSAPSTVFAGGPVEPNGFIGLARDTRSANQPDGRTEAPAQGLLVPGINRATSVDLDSDPVLTMAHANAFRIFRGYAGWDAHQLNTEIAEGAWFVVDPELDDPWDNDPTTLFERVLRRQEGDLRWFANTPADPSLN